MSHIRLRTSKNLYCNISIIHLEFERKKHNLKIMCSYIYKGEDFELSMFSSLFNESIFNISNLLLGIFLKIKFNL
jgi:hypothetical protein